MMITVGRVVLAVVCGAAFSSGTSETAADAVAGVSALRLTMINLLEEPKSPLQEGKGYQSAADWYGEAVRERKRIESGLLESQEKYQEAEEWLGDELKDLNSIPDNSEAYEKQKKLIEYLKLDVDAKRAELESLKIQDRLANVGWGVSNAVASAVKGNNIDSLNYFIQQHRLSTDGSWYSGLMVKKAESAIQEIRERIIKIAIQKTAQ